MAVKFDVGEVLSRYPCRLVVLDHPLLQEMLTVLRDRGTPYHVFRSVLEELGVFMAYEVARGFDVEEVLVETPLARARGVRVSELDRVLVVAVLRAAIPFAYGMLRTLKRARLTVIAARRVEEEHAAPSYEFEIEVPYDKIPEDASRYTVIVADPMFASGCTMLEVLKRIYARGRPRRAYVVTVIATPLAASRVLEAYPDVKLYTLAVDPELDDRGYIVPGLGDAGDRALGVG